MRPEDRVDDRQRKQADRKVDVEDPAPRQVVDDEAAGERSDHGRDAEDAAEEALIAPALARGDNVTDYGDGRDYQPAAAEALHDAERDELGQVLGHPAQRRAGEEDDNRRLQHDAAAEEIAELAVKGNDDRRR